jgi:hypothetical protein
MSGSTSARGGRVTAAARRAPAESLVNDFDSQNYKAQTGPKFRLGGKWWHCRGNVPWNIMAVPPDASARIEQAIRAMSGIQSGDRDLEAEANLAGEVYTGYREFFASVLVEEEVDPFFKMIDGENTPLHSGNLQPLVDYIMENIGEPVPKEQPKPSERGSRSTSKKSGASSSSQGTAQTRSAS